MITVPFDVEGYHGISARGKVLNSVELSQTLDNAYKTMEWFKYLADHATTVEVLEKYVHASTFMTTYIVGFELDGKYETYYRLKYNDG